MEKIPEFIANHLILVTLFVAILSMLMWNMMGAAMTGVQQISTAELTRQVNKSKAVILDIRQAEDYQAGHIIAAVNMPTTQFEEKIKTLKTKKDIPLIIYCAMGNDSMKACRIAKMNGYEQVTILKGGLHSWQGANLPVVKA